MSAFSPLTFGYDWEIWTFGQNMLPPDGGKVERIAGRVSRELPPMDAHREWRHFECGVGICHDWQTLLDRTLTYASWLREQFVKDELVLFPCGSNALEHGGAGLHVHIGTISDARTEIRVAAAFTRYLPALLALMANGATGNWTGGKWKSYRMAGDCWGSGGVNHISEPHLASPQGWGDIAVKRSQKPTMEFRLSDSSLCPRLVAEYALIVAGLADYIADHEEETGSFGPEEYEDFVTNRWLATKYGLQATFSYGGREVSATSAVAEIVQEAAAGMGKLGASEDDLVIVPTMLAKRRCQADFQLDYLTGHTDLVAFTNAFANALAEPEAFEKYLELSSVLPAQPFRPIEEAILDHVGRRTKLWRLMDAPFVPPVMLNEKLQKLEKEGRVALTNSPEDGPRCTRLDRAEVNPPACSRRL